MSSRNSYTHKLNDHIDSIINWSKIIFIALLVFYALAYPSIANAGIYSRHDIRFFRENDQVCSTSSIGSVPGEDNLHKIYNFFLIKGASKKAAAAMTGNIYQESKGDPLLIQGGERTNKPETVGLYPDGSLFENKQGQGSVGKAWGLPQWDPGNAALYWQKRSGVTGDISKLEVQLEVIWWQLNNYAPTSQKNVLARIEAAPDLDSAVEIVSKKFHGAGRPIMENRKKAAALALSYEVDPNLVGQQSSSSTSDNCPSNVGPLEEGGLNFEQAKQVILNYGANVGGDSKKYAGAASWNRCNGGGSNCVTFSQFFLNKFSKTKSYSLPDGRKVVATLREMGVPTGNQPRVGAIFSWDGGRYGHTGVVLGVKDGKVIVGQASCGSPGRGRGDGTYNSGSGFLREGAADNRRVWLGKVPTQFAYPEVDMKAVEAYFNGSIDVEGFK